MKPVNYRQSRIYFALIICIATLCYSAVAHARENRSKHFYFAQITDTHLGSRDHLERTQRIIRRINALPMNITCVVHTGDIFADNIDDPNLVSKARTIFDKLDAPMHMVPGNHDILSNRLHSTIPIYREAFGDLITSAQYNQVVFLFVYTEPLRKSLSVKGYQPLIHLQQHLERAKRKSVIVFHHAPSVKNFYNNKVHRGWRSEIKEKWIALLNAYNVKAVIAGHFHRDEFHWLDKVPLYIAGPVAGFWGRQASYRVYEYRDGRIGYTTQYID